MLRPEPVASDNDDHGITIPRGELAVNRPTSGASEAARASAAASEVSVTWQAPAHRQESLDDAARQDYLDDVAPIDVPKELPMLLDRVANVDVPALDRMFAAAALREGLDKLLAELAQVAREEDGHSWADVGSVLNITKQAAQQRLGKAGVITVGPDGTITTSESRDDYVADLRAALERLSSPGDEAMRQVVADTLDRIEKGGDVGPDGAMPVRIEVPAGPKKRPRR